MPEFTKYDYLLADDGPAAIVFKQWLKPVGDEIIFPPTYANPSKEKSDPVYNIDPADDVSPSRVCVIDSIPSQGNRIEPAFETIAGGTLVPQIYITAIVDGTETKVNLLAAGHRAADALVRFSGLAEEIRAAIRSRKTGDSMPLAKLAPTSLLFGMWDSRETGVKIPRLINSIIRAYDVRQFRRSAQYFPAINFEAAGVGKEDEKKASTEGMAEVPAVFKHGGISAAQDIIRDASLNLCTLREITTAPPEMALKLRRYILGLALVALTHFDGKSLNLRQGCQLVSRPDKAMDRKLIFPDGHEQDLDISREKAVSYAEAAAADFGVDQNKRVVAFDPARAKAALKKTK